MVILAPLLWEISPLVSLIRPALDSTVKAGGVKNSKLGIGFVIVIVPDSNVTGFQLTVTARGDWT